jgi:isoleucyl-tRNA synthetase
LTVALDVHITEELKKEGLSRELINRLQNLRKDKGLEVTDRINVKLTAASEVVNAANENLSYICTEILADSLVFEDSLTEGETIEIDGKELKALIQKN